MVISVQKDPDRPTFNQISHKKIGQKALKLIFDKFH